MLEAMWQEFDRNSYVPISQPRTTFTTRKI